MVNLEKKRGQFTIGFAASKDSKNLDTVKEIFDLWSTPEYADLWFEGNAGFPAFDGVNGGEVPGADYPNLCHPPTLYGGRFLYIFSV